MAILLHPRHSPRGALSSDNKSDEFWHKVNE